MSASVMSPMLANLLNNVESSNQPYANGIGNNIFLKGLDFTSYGDSGGGNSGIAGGLGSLFGPAGAGLGLVTSLIPGLDGFLKSGFDFSCLGSQAFTKGELDQRLNMLKSEVDKVQPENLNAVQNFINFCSYQIGWAEKAISQFSSGCSKSLMGKFKEACQSSLDSVLPQYKTTQSMINGQSHMGDFQIADYKVLGLNGGSTNQNSAMNIPDKTDISIQEFEKQFKPQLTEYALANGLDVQQTINQAFEQFKISGLSGSGGISGDGWQVGGSFGQKEPNYILYALIAVGGLLAYKIFKK